MPDYVCKGRLPEEVYCCEPGGSIDRDSALAQSCGPFFAPTRLMLERAAWQRYWGARLNAPLAGEFAWLRDPAGLAPERSASLASLLRALASMPPAGRADAENALLRVVLDGRGADSVRWFGSRLRVKTYSPAPARAAAGATRRRRRLAGRRHPGLVWRRRHQRRHLPQMGPPAGRQPAARRPRCRCRLRGGRLLRALSGAQPGGATWPGAARPAAWPPRRLLRERPAAGLSRQRLDEHAARGRAHPHPGPLRHQ
ncbi:DUF2300 domain-containing protein [Massilia sp. Se16.2.3]|uniref:DUF2300 domain-containing protein n=1 Tax=Massilia sp. Se16.2.3 TaxID=2709303 RepID=UPI001E5D3EB2|nr:DUF2300 domain-containing protein [Massilia sp. Se16.2.3]